MKRWKDTYVSRNSALHEALERGDGTAKKIYDDTTANAIALYGKEAYVWFVTKSKGEINEQI